MPQNAPAGRHAAARHRGQSTYERTRDRVCDTLLDLPSPAVGGRVVAVTAVGGVLAAGAVLGTQAAMTSGSTQAASADVAASDLGAVDLAGRDDAATTQTSRDAARPSLDQAKQAAEKATASATTEAPVVTETSKVDTSDPKDLAKKLLGDFGWGEDQFSCLDDLWVGESNWRVDADNPTSSAYGIPQALPGNKMASEGADWATNPVTQIRWGLKYIDARYGSPCAADSFKRGNNWY
ncbi:lytic transglycosylase domain-containing protein [Solicola sp. PLA-1-18]|uniref:aggregation-promoting factor C-terminal-like domain-containing protein n=1 Tax=Solicola sp. PLA-1-18 TaxID=3380532 RepID=UPI003B7F4322